jgi:hypothetical protein
MKSLKILLVLVTLILSGFSKDLQRTGGGVVKTVKFDGVIITNPSSGPTVCAPMGNPYPYIAHARTGWLQGNQSHGGKLITERSTWEIFSCSTDFTTGLNTSQIAGVNTVANGDSYYFTCTMIVNIVTNDVILNINITGGVGIFEGATGQMSLTGVHTESGIPIKGQGFISIPK